MNLISQELKLLFYSISNLEKHVLIDMEKRIFGELKLAILNVFKKESSACTVRDVLQTLGREDKYTTIMTVMNRLVLKSILIYSNNLPKSIILSK